MDEQRNQDDRVPSLSEADAAAVDAFLEARAAAARTSAGVGGSPPMAPAEQSPRAAALFALVGSYGDTFPPASLVDSTVNRVAVAASALRITEAANEPRRLSMPSLSLRLPEILTVAAMIVIGTSLALPVLVRTREDARRFACEANLTMAGGALLRYAADHDDIIPRGRAMPGVAWWNVGMTPRRGGTVESNSAHLYLLVRGGYVSADTLACPEYADAPRGMNDRMHDWPRYEAVSYSYQNQYSKEAVRLSHAPSIALLADKNPLFSVMREQGLHMRQDIPATAASSTHDGRGQNVLASSGAVRWMAEPVFAGDNIWLADGVHHYTGTEGPAGPDDTFLVP